ncbi:MAG: response regulator transcription factor, partial [Bacteroidales bacterium]|nr:response regulator transcription factor [Bacteroidales bacterium]
MANKRILVVDDEEDLCEILRFNLESEGYEVDTAHSAEEALQMDLSRYQLLMLDVMMGNISGFKMADLVRKNPATKGTPVMFLTAKDTENDKLTGFNLGADDYISKPFSIREVIMRVKAILRRTQVEDSESVSEMICFDAFCVDVTRKKVFIGKQAISLTKKEFEMLVLLVSHPGRVY